MALTLAAPWPRAPRVVRSVSLSGTQLLWLALLLVLVLLPVVVLGRMAWRIFVKEDEQPEPGGSLGRQFLGRSEKRRRT